jgi:hypothetical protein
VFELFHKGDFADGGAGGAFFAVEVDLFEGDQLAGLPITAFEDLEIVRLGWWDRREWGGQCHTVA